MNKIFELNGKKVKLFTLSANPKLAEEISEYTKIPLSEITAQKFADGEINIASKESVRGCHVFIVQPTNNPVNEHLMELFIFVDSLKRASAKTITVLMPYYGYSRQDRKAESRQPITAKLVADLLQVTGIDRIICMDLHASQLQGFFDIPIDNFPAGPLLAKYILQKKVKDWIVVSPDHGGATRARLFAKNLGGVPMAIIDKRRPQPNVAEVLNIIGDVKGKTAVIIDDIIDTAGTLVAASDALIKAGVKKVYAVATHPIFSGSAYEKIQNSSLEEVIVTNTIQLKEENKPDKITQISIGKELGQVVLNLITDNSVSQIFDIEEILK